MRILIVDDEAEIRKILHILLENSGYEVLEASDGLAAVAALKTDDKIDLCIMDCEALGIPTLTKEEIARMPTHDKYAPGT